jgi:hypothetical protein
MTTFRNHQSSKRIKGMVVGEPGRGKTGLMATVANAGYTLWFVDLDNKLGILGSYLQADAVDRVHYKTIQPRGAGAWAAIEKLVWEGDAAEGWPSVYKMTAQDVLVIDSGTRLGRAALRAALTMNQKSMDSASFDQTIYGVCGQMLENFVARLTAEDVPANVVILTHIRSVTTDKTTGAVQDFPELVGQQFPKLVGSYMDFVFRVDVQNGKRSLRTQSDFKMPTLMSNAPTIVKDVEEFDLGKIFKRVREHLSKVQQAEGAKVA